MPYSEILIKPMREDLTNIGIEETRTPEQVEDAIANTKGTLLVVVNSVCGCAAGKARPGVAMALQNEARPDRDENEEKWNGNERHRIHRSDVI